jgi:cytoskeletal protein RodZ
MTPDELLAIGTHLRTLREERGYSLEQVAASTRIRAKFLAQIETGEVDGSLSEMQWRGFLRNYAAYMRLDLDALLWAYRQQANEKAKGLFGRKTKTQTIELPLSMTAAPKPPIAAIPPAPAPSYAPPQPEPQRTRWGILALSLLVGLGLLVGGGMLATQILQSSQEAQVSPIAPLAIEGLETATAAEGDGLTTSPPDPKWGGEVVSPTPATSPTAAGIMIAPPQSTPVQPNLENATTVSIAIQANQRSWVRVEVDGRVEYENIMRPETSLQYQATRSITLRTSNAGGLNVMVNNQPLGPLGGRGELYESTFAVGEPIVLPATPTPNQPTALETVDVSRPEPILPVVPDNMQPTPTATLDPNLPTPLPTFAPVVTEQAPGG